MNKFFSEMIKKEMIINNLEASTKEEALTYMTEYLIRKGYCKKSFTEAILKREETNPSALPMSDLKIAIPHTDSEHVNKSVILFAKLKKPVTFRVMGSPEETIDVPMISMFALKEANDIGAMLTTLLTVYQQEEILRAIWNSSSVDEIYAILSENIEKYGAK